MHRRLVFLLTLLIVFISCGIARADYVTNHYPGGHGPLSAAGTIPTWGTIEVCCVASTGGGERWLGSIGSYDALISPLQSGQNWIRKSPAPNTYAVAYEHATYPYGNSYVVTSSWVNLAWPPAMVSINYEDFCPLTPGMNTVHVCTSDWTPMDGGGVPTYVIGNGIVKPGLPYGDYLKDTSGGGPPGASWCGFYFSWFSGLTKPTGAPDHGVAIDACP